MKAPEKIYCGNNGHGNLSYSNQMFPNAFEYTRTDAFIEKACAWLEENLSKYSELTDEDEYGNKLGETVMNVFHGQAVIDFQAYMKGE